MASDMTWKEKAQSAMARARGAAAKHERVIEGTVRTLLTGGAAFGVSFYQARSMSKDGKPAELFNLPVPLVLGLLCKGLTFTSVGAKHADHLDAIGDGSFAAYTAALGSVAGAKKK